MHAPCNIALSLQNKLEKELEEMVKQGIIGPVEGYSNWVNSLVIRDKPNGILSLSRHKRPQEGHQKRAPPIPNTTWQNS